MMKHVTSGSLRRKSSTSDFFGGGRKNSTATTYTTSEKVDIRPKKPRRHTTGGTKQTQEDILIAKHFTSEMENGGKVINEYGQEIDPNSTLGRKQLISMLKQRYGQDIENYRTSSDVGEKERMRRERQKERDRRHEQRSHHTDEREVDHRYIQNGVVVTNTTITNDFHRRGSGGSAASCTSESDGGPGSPPAVTQHKVLRKSISAVHARQHSSDEEHEQMRMRQHFQHSTNERAHSITNEQARQTNSKEVVFLQYRDEMKRVNLPYTIGSLDAVKVLFVNAFPGLIAMPHFESQEKAIYIKDMDTGVYFQLEDINDISNRSFLKIHEREIASSEKQYAESLPDLELRRTNSGSSLRSDNVLTRPTFLKEQQLQPQRQQEQQQHSETTTNDAYLKEQQSTTNNNSYFEQSMDTTNNSSNNTYMKVQQHNVQHLTDQHSAKASTNINTTTTNSNNNNNNNAYVIKVHDYKQQQKNVRQDKQVTGSSPNGSINSASKLDENLDKALNTSVHDQLDDLTELLKTALHDEEKHADMMYDIVDTKNPGKINPKVIDSLQYKMEESARKTSLPKHFQPTVIVKAQQEADIRNSPLPRKISSDATPPPSPVAKKVEPPKTTVKKSSVKVTIRATASAPSSRNKQPPVTSPKPSRVTEDFFEPPKKQSYVVQNTASKTSQKFDMSELDDIVKESPKSPRKGLPESKDTSEVESDLLEQLQNMEDEMKQYSSNLEETQRSSASSNKSNTGAFTYATVNKKSTSSTSSVPESPKTPRSRVNSNTSSFSSHSDAATEFEKLKSMTIHDQSKTAVSSQQSSDSKFSRQQSRDIKAGGSLKVRMTSSTSSDTTDGVFITENSSTTTTKKSSESSFTRTSSSASTKTKPTRQICLNKSSVSAPDFSELEKAAQKVKTSLEELKKDLSVLRKTHIDNTRNFKNDIQKKMLEFRKKAFRVDEYLKNRIDQNNNNMFANDHPVREQRHRLTDDQVQYAKKMSSAEYRVHNLETSLENVRLDVVGKKRVDNPSQLVEFHEELITVTQNVNDTKNKYYGIETTLQQVTKMEMEVIEKEQQFMKDEPEKLEILVTRCKTLSGTLETLQKLAKMQQEVTRKKSYPDYQEILEVNTSTKEHHHVHFKR